MWICSNIISFVADWMLESGRFTHTVTRKIINSVGQYGPAVCLVIASYTGCNRYLTVAVLTIGLGLNGGIYSGLCGHRLNRRSTGYMLKVLFLISIRRLQNKSSRPHTALRRHSDVVYQLLRQLFRPPRTHRRRQHHRGQGESGRVISRNK